MTTTPAHLAQLDSVHLDRGEHGSFEDGPQPARPDDRPTVTTRNEQSAGPMVLTVLIWALIFVAVFVLGYAFADVLTR